MEIISSMFKYGNHWNIAVEYS
uniref:Uncharacterized protein n=1 Tax=Rhizophora mucronata TaxID=61149 RepID=A0A2P2NW93_RHIMU